jgi:hypothetical protein
MNGEDVNRKNRLAPQSILPFGSNLNQLLINNLPILIHQAKIQCFVCPDRAANVCFIEQLNEIPRPVYAGGHRSALIHTKLAAVDWLTNALRKVHGWLKSGAQILFVKPYANFPVYPVRI